MILKVFDFIWMWILIMLVPPPGLTQNAYGATARQDDTRTPDLFVCFLFFCFCDRTTFNQNIDDQNIYHSIISVKCPLPSPLLSVSLGETKSIYVHGYFIVFFLNSQMAFPDECRFPYAFWVASPPPSSGWGVQNNVRSCVTWDENGYFNCATFILIFWGCCCFFFFVRACVCRPMPKASNSTHTWRHFGAKCVFSH